MKRFILLGLLLMLPLAGWAGDFEAANQAYAKGHYTEAARLYERLTSKPRVSADVYYNLGGSYYRLHDAGRAILNYERARLLRPRDADIAYNLEAARLLASDNLPDISPWGGFSLAEALWTMAAVNLMLMALLGLRLYRKPEWSAYALIVATVLEITVGLGCGFKFWQFYTDDRAVVVAREVTALAGPQQGDTALFKLHSGSIVRLKDREAGWSLIESGSNQGWLSPGSLERIRP